MRPEPVLPERYNGRVMPKERTKDDLRKDEKEIGTNIPEAMKGEDDADSARGTE
ncbi:MAG: hypothetical protein QOE90_3255 [Thermoplasmata archaeon]|jgi:hypothetical protein|nr:hypothetical protein [Thermoplasmata archaeon]